MAATRENVLAAIAQYVETNKRRAPAYMIASMVSDTVPNVQAIIKTLVTEGSINSSRGRNGGALPDGVTLERAAKVAKAIVESAPQPATEAVSEDVTDQFAALMQQLESDEAHAE